MNDKPEIQDHGRDASRFRGDSAPDGQARRQQPLYTRTPQPSADSTGAGHEQRDPSRHSPVRRVPDKTPPKVAPDDRRDFFSEAMREAIAPFVGLIDRRINPILSALEAIPDEVERMTKLPEQLGGVLDQPQERSRRVSLPQATDTPVDPVDPPRYLRPPGALPPGEFESVCSCCGKCAEVCPAHAIQLDPYKFQADGFPHIEAISQPCVLCESLACMAACPSGALRPLDRLKIRMGTARVMRSRCRRENGEDCRLCVDICPLNGDGASPLGEALVIHEPTGRLRVRKNVCVGCGLCENACPTDPRAIRVKPWRGRVDPIIA